MKSYSALGNFLLSISVGVLSLGVTPPAQGEEEKKGLANHASIVAYPEAIISLKDPKTQMVFYVESNGRRLVAITKEGMVAWSVDVLDETKIAPALGQPVIRHLRLQEGDLWVTYGKSDTAKVEIKSGKVKYLGAD
ncbi:MAG: hypothetical protein NZ700_12265 [Gemmataceae bacterium]|nr:hypothetical protein [Gemmataceae bacterium]MDW8264868.1 hypothetical protein [Gemmataceae bacterium]